MTESFAQAIAQAKGSAVLSGATLGASPTTTTLAGTAVRDPRSDLRSVGAQQRVVRSGSAVQSSSSVVRRLVL